jgi:hydroxyethylthiazole kinase-like uncharacterized protein yjeF
VTVVSAAEMRALDRWTIEHGTPGHVLMERAGAGAVRAWRRALRPLRRAVVVVCGRGNNGGDGFVIARHLRRAGCGVEVWLAARPDEVRGDAARMLSAWRRQRGAVREMTSAAHVQAFGQRLARASAVVDALLGTGLNAPVGGLMADLIGAINAAGAPVFAVDVPSGLSADTGHPLGVAVRAAATATFGLPKVGQVVYPGIDLVGRLDVVDIGIPAAALDAVRPQTVLLDEATVGALLPPRPRDAHKGTFGHLAVVAGSTGKLGAALLATEASARAGAGLVTLGVPAPLQPLAEGRVREAMTVALPAPGGVDELLAGRSAVACGPGLGTGPEARALVAALVERARVPMLLDADGLNLVAGTDLLRRRPAPTVVTPHPGEMARLLGTDTRAVQADRLAAARRLAADTGVVVVLKGARTVIADPGGAAAIVPAGNPGLASGGTGDVLSGIVGGLLAQGLVAWDAARLGVFAHAAAADAVAARRGETGLVARDVVRELPPTLARLQEAARAGAGTGA